MKNAVIVFIMVISMPWILAGCSKSVEKKTSPSSIENPVKESDLTTIKLTDKAVERLGIRTQEIESKSVKIARLYSGEVMSVPGRSMTLVAPVPGTILGVSSGALPAAGSTVRKGQALFRLLILPSEKDLLGATEDVKLKKVQYEVAVEKYNRATQMLKDKAGSIRAKQEAEAELANVTAALRVAEARVDLMKGSSGVSVSDKLSTLDIASSIDGVIQKVYASPSQVVTANAPVMDVAALNPVWVRIQVYAGDLSQVNRERPASVRLLSDFGRVGPEAVGKPVDGPRTADPLNTSADLFYELPNRDLTLRPGQKVSVTLSFKQEETSRVIPYSAIVYDIQGGTWIYENPEQGIFIRRRVELGGVENSLAILRRGPDAGTRIVIEGAAELFGTEFGSAK